MRIEQIDPFNDTAAVDCIIKVYQEAFGGEPWNEGWRCRVCEHVVPLHPAMSSCPKCHKLTMEQYWPYTKVLADFQSEMKRPKPLCLVATDSQQIVAFAWGYEVQGDEPGIDDHLDAPGLHKELVGPFFYLDDIAVRPDRQRDGIGKELIKKLFEKQDNRRMLLRTLQNSQMCRLILGLAGQIVLPISRNRVIMTLFGPGRSG